MLPAVFDPEEAMRAGAPVVHDKGADAFIRNPERNILIEVHGGVGDVEAGFAEADVIHEGTYSTHRGQHAHLETHCSIAWVDEDKRLNVRTTSQSPFICRDKLCYLFGLGLQDVRVFCERVGGGFGGKQEVLTEDLTALAAMKTGRPVQWEFTREEQFVASTYRHPMRTTVKLGAKRDGTLTGIQLRIVSNTGAYGNHGGETLFHACSESVALYRCPNKKIDAYTVYTNTVPSGAIRGYGLTQTIYAVECAMDELARALEHGPVRAAAAQRRQTGRRDGLPGRGGERRRDRQLWTRPVRRHRARRPGPRQRRDAPRTEMTGWSGRASPTPCTIPRRRPSIAPRRASALLEDGTYELAIGTAEFGNGTTTQHAQIAATTLGTTVSRVHIVQSDTDRTGYDTGPSPAPARLWPARRSASPPRRCASASSNSPPQHTQVPPGDVPAG